MLLRVPFLGTIILEKLKSDGGLLKIRRFFPDEAPTFYPILPLTEEESLRDGNRNTDVKEMTGFNFFSIDDYTSAYRNGLSPVVVAQSFLSQLDRSEQDSPSMKCFVSIIPADILAQAVASEARWKVGKPLSPIDGVPVAIKDEIDQAGHPTSLGTKFLAKYGNAIKDSEVVSRLRHAGALLVGKTNMHEIGINVTGLNPHHGTPRNPYNDQYHTGGSSSGSACSVACGLVPIAIGADGGGSIRVPSSFCGLVGMKPTFGRVSEHGAAPLAWSVGHIGPITSNVFDCALAYSIIAGKDVNDRNTNGQPPVLIDAEKYIADLVGIKLGVFLPWLEHATSEVVASTKSLLQKLQALGATVHNIEIPDLDAMRVAHTVLITGDMATAMLCHEKEEFSLDASLNLLLGKSHTARDYINAARIRTRAMNIFQDIFKSVDVIVTPTCAQTAPKINSEALTSGESDLSTTVEIMRFVFASNLTGHPAISFPSGYGANELPIGMQLIGKPWSEQLLFRVASVAENLVEKKKPVRYYPIITGGTLT